MNFRYPLAALCVALACSAHSARAQFYSFETQTVNSAIDVLQGFTAFRAQSIPQSMLADAQAIAIIPNVVKGGFIIAGRFGRGVLAVRNPDGSWRAPVFVTFTGGSFGWQAGLQSTDVVLVFKNRKGVESLLSGSEFTLGADASIAAGPVGRQASAGTDLKLNAEIYSYSRSRGLFGGVALDGSVLKVDNGATAAFYGNQNVVPQPAMQLLAMIAKETAPGAPAANGERIDPNTISPGPGTVVAQPTSLYAAAPSETPAQVQPQLVEASRQLDALIDPQWRTYLALPPEVLKGGEAPSDQKLIDLVARYTQVRQDPNYRALTDRREFQTTYDLLGRYAKSVAAARAAEATRAAEAASLRQLPPPPGAQAQPAIPQSTAPQAGTPRIAPPQITAPQANAVPPAVPQPALTQPAFAQPAFPQPAGIPKTP